MTVRDKKGNIAKHGADALIFAGTSDFEPDQLKAVEERYEGITDRFQKFCDHPKVQVGTMAEVSFDDADKVIFVKVSPTAQYTEIRQIFEELLKKAKKWGLGHVVCAPIGQKVDSKHRIHPDAIELIARSVVVDAQFAIDVYTEHTA